MTDPAASPAPDPPLAVPAAVPVPPAPGDVVGGLTLRPVPPGDPDRDRALAVLLTGRDAPRDPAVEAFVDYAGDTGLDTRRLWAGFQGGRPAAAAIALPGPGGTAMVLLSPIRAPGRVPPAAALGAAVVDALPRGPVKLVQCLLDVDQLYEQAALIAAGFHKLARLTYLQRAIDPADEAGHGSVRPGSKMQTPDDLPPVILPDAEVTLWPWDESRRPWFAAAVLGSYEDTRDCPALVGSRNADEVLAGHRGTGVFDPALWTVALVDDQPAAVLMLSTLPARDAAELVYLGVTKAVRGRGLGRQLLRRAIAQAARLDVSQLLLAVDEQNAPALALYRRHGFRSQSRRTAMVRFFPGR